MRGRTVFWVLLGTFGAFYLFAKNDKPQLYAAAPAYSAVSPEEWFVSVKADLKSARIAARQNNVVVLEAIAKSAISYRGQISAWTRVPSAANVYSVCGDLVIAMADLPTSTAAALKRASALEDACRDAIIPPIR